MPYIKVNTLQIESMREEAKKAEMAAKDAYSVVAEVKRRLDWKVSSKSNIDSTLSKISRKLSDSSGRFRNTANFLDYASGEYSRVEKNGGEKKRFDLMAKAVGAATVISQNSASKPQWYSPETETPKSKFDIFIDEFKDKFGWSVLLGGSNYIKKIYDLVKEYKNSTSKWDLLKVGKKTYDSIKEAIKTANNYKKIGNAVGGKKAVAWWAKAVTGLKPLGRASEAKDVAKRFIKNLKNKTSPFNIQKAYSDFAKDLTGANGFGKAISKWGSIALDGVLNFFSNKDEQAKSNGTMSNGRVIAETITETAVGTALTIGTKCVIGAAVTTILGTTAAPAVVVVALTGVVTIGINAGIKALTGKETTELISDFILDTGERIIEEKKKLKQALSNIFGNKIKNANNAQGRWYNKLSFA